MERQVYTLQVQDSIVVTKLSIPPPRAQLVPRPALIERLNSGIDRKLTLVSAPAGFGKTTLVSDWVDGLQATGKIDGRPLKVAWLSLDEDDNDPVRFLTYFSSALNWIDDQKAIGKGALGILQAPQPPPQNAILISLINDLASIPDKIAFVIDDYHMVESELVHQAVQYLLENLPPQLHPVILTRQDPHLPISKLRASNQISELRAADLRFNQSEAAAFLNTVMGLNLSEQDVARLEARTEGWIAGLQLAALSIQGRSDASSRIEVFSGSNRLVLDYLMEEVLEGQPEHIEQFLLRTSILDKLSGPLCDALTGQADGQATLEMLDDANMFLIPMDEERRWYRYHHLFAQMLHQRLCQSQPEEVSSLCMRASHWLNQQGLHREAIRYSLEGRDYEGAAESISAIAVDILQKGQHTEIVKWIDELPEELVNEQPYLCVLHAWSLQLTGDLETAEDRLVKAEIALKEGKCKTDGDLNLIQGLIDSRRAYSSFMRGEHKKTITFAQKAVDGLPSDANLIRAQTALYQGIAYRYSGQMDLALAVYTGILPIPQSIAGSSIAAFCYLHLGDLYSELARLHKAKEIYEQGLRMIERQFGHSEVPFSGYFYVSIGQILRQWNQLEDAYQLTSKGLALCRDWNVADILAFSYLEFAYINQAMGEDEQALESLEKATGVFRRISAWGVDIAEANQAKFDILNGNVASAESWVRRNDLEGIRDFRFHRDLEYLVLARALLSLKRFKEAQALLEIIIHNSIKAGRAYAELEGHILVALAFSAQGDLNRALAHLEKALAIGEPEDFIRIFIDEGDKMAQLLYQALQAKIAPEYVQRIMNSFAIDESYPSAAGKSSTRQSSLIEPLSEREIEVLELIAKGLTNQVIADRLVLSLHTVKAHTRNIYGKLDVHNRTQAADRARSLGILSPL
jgi:LuxR family maltose regulon positive regulatory protein